jgi:putative acetyltransferase
MNGLTYRPCRVTDAPGLAMLYHRAVHEGAGRHYSAAQCAAWSPAPPMDEGWRHRLIAAQTIVAAQGDQLFGFMTLDPATGWLDFAYVAPEAMGQGVADTLYAITEGRARATGLRDLETEASLLGERFFRRHGWRVLRRTQKIRDDIALPSVLMRKALAGPRFAAA